MIDKRNLAMNRLINRTNFEVRNYRLYFRFAFWNYMCENGFDPIAVSQMNESEITAMWEMFQNDANGINEVGAK